MNSPSSAVSNPTQEKPILSARRPTKDASADKVIDLCPGKTGVSMIVRVIDVVAIAQRKFPNGTVINVAEVLLADDTASVIFSARNEQIDILKDCEYVKIEKGKVEMFENYIRLIVDKWGKLFEAQETFAYLPEGNVELNISNVEYTLV